MYWITGAIFILLLLSAFFSGSETALTATSRPLMHQLRQKGRMRAGLVARLLDQKERLIGAILLGNNLVNILASALATSALITLFGEAGVVYATIGMTLLVLIFAEILPKTYALRHPNRTALAISPIINAMVIVLGPITLMINAIVRLTLKLFGIDMHTQDSIGEGNAELRGAIALHTGDHEDVHHERAMLRSVLDLAEVQVGEIMTHRKNVETINADIANSELIDQMLASPYTRIPLWQGTQDNIVGVLHAKALLRAIRGTTDATSLNVTDLAAVPWFVPEHTLLLDQLQAFRQRREHFALVVDEYGALMGIVTLEDILEEIVGDISDEHDVTVSGVSIGAGGSFVIQGDVTIRDLNRELGWSLPDEEAATIAGLILHEARRIPEVSQIFLFHGFRFEILARQRQQLTKVRVTPPQPTEA